MAGGLLGLVRLLSGVEQASLRGSIATLSDGTTTNLSSGDTEDTTTVSLASSMSASSVLDAVHNAAVGVFEAFTRWTYIWPFQQGISRNPDFRIILIDAVGHEMVLQVGMSWNDVHTALLERFRGRAGWNYVQSNSYNLLVPGTSPDRISVIEPHAWGQTVQAGLIVEMSIVIRQQSTSAQCPYCNLSTSQDSMNRRVICSGCGESYVASETQAHVEEVEETNDLVQPSIETTHPDGLSGSSPLRLSTELEINHRDTGRSSPMQLSVETTHPDPRSPMPVLPIPSSFGPAPAPLQDEDPSVSIGLSAPVLNNHEATPPAATFDQHEPREPDDLKLFNSVTVLHSHKRSNFQASHLENRLFALLIGVDTYKYLNEAQHLKGAVRDAKRVGDFLCQQNPPVSKERIIFLKNEEATVDSIITQLKGLCKNTEIQRGDPILIYYAGHGSTLLKPEGWMNEDSRIQCLSAHDARTGPDGTVIGVVSDRTFGCLLQRLADAKGNKITVILDCCYSGSGTRDEETVPRGIEFKAADGLTDVTVNPSYQQNYWASVDSHRQVVVASQFANAGLRSHVVLAACGPNESAFEDRIKNEGRFTSAFLRVLEKAGTDTLTYAELIRRLDYLPSQTPRCEGRDKETRILFDSGLKQHDRDCYAIKNSGATHSPYIISAGQIHGIGKGDVFAVYRDRDAFTSEDEPLGRLVASVVSLDSSLASLADDSLSSVLGMAGAVAVLSRVHSPDAFRVNIAINDAVLRERVSEVLERMVKESADSAESSSLPNSSKPRVTQAAASKASIVIVSDGEDMVTFTYQSEHIYGTLGIERLSGPVRTNKDTLASALRSAAHFFRHLGPSPSSSHFLLRDHVDVRIWELEGGVGISDEGRFVNTYKPKGNFIDAKLCGMFRPTLSHVNGQNPTQTLYGVDVVNRSGLGLYLWLFYFDCSTLQILEYYSPVVTAGNGEPPLREGMTLPLNYGDSGGIPLAFEVPDGQEADGGFLRIFLTTRPIDMSKVAQNGVIGRPGEVTTEDVWDAVTIPVKLK
ncbi:hypothetical protein PENSPDRAFT_667856 [Peniophora sp. CONT]|nr:hypothetical protein PENSPDRAFT_667856 [Peniophora sp. CONT]